MYFRVVFEGRVLQFKLPITSSLSVLFAKVPVVGDFVWHGIVLDGSLSPSHYNMLPGEQHCVTIHVVLNHRNAMTYADEVMTSDAVRSVSFRLRLKEEENDSLRVELEELQAQIFALHRELNNVVEASAARVDEERRQRDLLAEERTELLATVRRLEAENDLMKRRKQFQQTLSKPHALYEILSDSISTGARLPPGTEGLVTPIQQQARFTTATAGTSLNAAEVTPVASARGSRTGSTAAAVTVVDFDFPLADGGGTGPSTSVRDAQQLMPRHQPSAALEVGHVVVQCVLMNESSQTHMELPSLDVPVPATVEKAIRCAVVTKASNGSAIVPPIDQCMICLRSKEGEYTVVNLEDAASLNAPVVSGDTLYIAQLR